MRKSDLIQVERMKRGRVRSKIMLVEVVKKDMLIKEATKRMTLDREE